MAALIPQRSPAVAGRGSIKQSPSKLKKASSEFVTRGWKQFAARDRKLAGASLVNSRVLHDYLATTLFLLRSITLPASTTSPPVFEQGRR